MSWRRIIWLSVVIAVMVIANLFYSFKKSNQVEDMIVNVASSSGMYLVNDQRLKEYLYQRVDTLVGQPVSDLNTSYLEYLMSENTHVKKVDAFVDHHNVLRINVDLKEPMLRFLGKKSRGYYISEDGELIHWSPDYTPRLIVVTGNLPEILPGDTLNETINKPLKILAKVGKGINSSSYLQSIVDEIIYKSENQIEIVSKIGKARILVGDTTELNRKLEQFELFYQEAYPIVGWDKYQLIDVRFKDKIYCRN